MYVPVTWRVTTTRIHKRVWKAGGLLVYLFIYLFIISMGCYTSNTAYTLCLPLTAHCCKHKYVYTTTRFLARQLTLNLPAHKSIARYSRRPRITKPNHYICAWLCRTIQITYLASAWRGCNHPFILTPPSLSHEKKGQIYKIPSPL